jgi:hypothetical protein
MLSDCTSHCRRQLARPDDDGSQGRNAAARQMLELLNPSSLFGFQEPEPLPREEWYPEMIADEIGNMAKTWKSTLLNVVRGGDYRPISRSGSFFDLPLPFRVKGTRNACEDERD